MRASALRRVFGFVRHGAPRRELLSQDEAIRCVVVDHDRPQRLELGQCRCRGQRGRLVGVNERQFEPERASPVDFAVEAESTAHHVDELTHDGQTEAGTAEASGCRRVGL